MGPLGGHRFELGSIYHLEIKDIKSYDGVLVCLKHNKGTLYISHIVKSKIHLSILNEIDVVHNIFVEKVEGINIRITTNNYVWDLNGRSWA